MRRVVAAVVVLGCGSSSPKPTPPPSPSPSPSPGPAPSASPSPSPDPTPTTSSAPALALPADVTCAIADNGNTREKIVLRYGGAPFAAIDTYDGADLALAAGGAVAMMHVVTAE